MLAPWFYFIIGFIFCAGGVYQFYRDAFEEDRSLRKAILVMIAGIVLIGLGTAKYLKLVQ